MNRLSNGLVHFSDQPPIWYLQLLYGTLFKLHRRAATARFYESGVDLATLRPAVTQRREWDDMLTDGTTIASKCTSATNQITGGFTARSESAFGDNPTKNPDTDEYECRRPHATVYAIGYNDAGTVRLLVETFDYALNAGREIILSRPQTWGRVTLPAKTRIAVEAGCVAGTFDGTQDYGPKTSAANGGRAIIVVRARTSYPNGAPINDLAPGESADVVNPVDWCGIFDPSPYLPGGVLRPDYRLNIEGTRNWTNAGFPVLWRFDSSHWLDELYGEANMRVYRAMEFDVIAGADLDPEMTAYGINEQDSKYAKVIQEFSNSGYAKELMEWEVPLWEYYFPTATKFHNFGAVGKSCSIEALRKIKLRDILNGNGHNWVFKIHHYAFLSGGGAFMNIDQYYATLSAGIAEMKRVFASLARQAVLGGWFYEDVSGPHLTGLFPGDTEIDAANPDAAVQAGRIGALLNLGRAAKLLGAGVGWDAGGVRKPNAPVGQLGGLDQLDGCWKPYAWARPLFTSINPGTY